MKKRQTRFSFKKIPRSHWKAIIFSVVSLIVLAIVAAYAANPALFAGLQSFAKNNATCVVTGRKINLSGCSRRVRDLYLQTKSGLITPTPSKTRESAEKSCEDSCFRIPSSDARNSCLASCQKFTPVLTCNNGPTILSVPDGCNSVTCKQQYKAISYDCFGYPDGSCRTGRIVGNVCDPVKCISTWQDIGNFTCGT